MPFLDITSLLTSLGAALHGTELRSSCDSCLRYKHLFLCAPPCQCIHSKQKEVGPWDLESRQAAKGTLLCIGKDPSWAEKMGH